MGSIAGDLRFALRSLARDPLVTGAALLSLALAIGATTSVFSLFHAVFLRDPPIAEPDRVVAVFTVQRPHLEGYLPVSHPNYEDLRDETGTFSDLVAVVSTWVKLSSPGGEPERILGELVDGPYFEMLGLRPSLGRVFAPGETETLGGAPVVVLSHRFWSRRFGADPGVIGGEITLNGRDFRVIGVGPRGFSGLYVLEKADFWAPAAMREALLTGFLAKYFDSRRALITVVYGRLAPAVSPLQARAALGAVGTALEARYPANNEDRTFTALPVAEATIYPTERGGYLRAGGSLLGAVTLILLLACFNVAHLLLARASARRREIAVRMAVGASRGRIVRQLLTESLLLAATAGAFGLLLATWGGRALWSLRPPALRAADVALGLDAWVVGFALALTLATGLLFGLAPALRASRPRLVDDLRAAADEPGGGALSAKHALVAAQVALAFVALIGSGLFLRSLDEAMDVDLGFRPGPIAMLRPELSFQGDDPARLRGLLDRIVETARTVAGVEEVALATAVPLAASGTVRTVLADRDAAGDQDGLLTPVNAVGPGFFDVLDVRVLRGRTFSPFDRADTLPVAIVNEALAERLWPGEDALGRYLRYSGPGETSREVVGVVATTKHSSLGEEPRPQLYLPRLQTDDLDFALLLRCAVEPGAVVAEVRREIQRLEPTLLISDARPLSSALHQALWAPRMAAVLFGALGVLALLLAAVGVYGVTAHAVRRRHHEIGIRMAMGAAGADVLRLVVVHGMVVVGWGLALGLAVAWAAGRRIESLLHGVHPAEPVTLAAAAIVLALVAGAAHLVPAWRATRVDPVRILRQER